MVQDEINLPPPQVISITLAKKFIVEMGPSLNSPSGMLVSKYRWSVPPNNTLKLNIDGVLFFDLNKAGLGIILRDHKGEIILLQVALNTQFWN